MIAIVMTIMVLELRPPEGTELSDLALLVPSFLAYLLSFVFLGIYWNNHHHLLQTTRRVNGAVLWANLNLLLWLSLLPFATGWLGENHSATTPAVAYGVVLLLSGLAYFILEKVIVAAQEEGSAVAAAIGSDRKGVITLVVILIGIALAFVAAGMPTARWASLRTKILNVPGRLAATGRRLVLHLPAAWPWGTHWMTLWHNATGPPPSLIP